VKIPAETPETGSTELETVGTVYHTAQTKRDDLSYREEPTTASELQTKERKVLQYDSKDRKQHDWSPLAEAPITKQPNSLLATANSYSSSISISSVRVLRYRKFK